MTEKDGTNKMNAGVRWIFLAVLSGLLLGLAFPKFSLWPLAWVALVPFFYALNRSERLGGTLLCGLAFGLTFFGFDLYWINTLSRFVGGWAVLGWVSLALFQTLFLLLFSVFYWLFSLAKLKFVRPLLAALTWTALEWLRAFGPFGVTGGDLGYSQAHWLALIQVASLAEVYGVSFLVVFFNLGLAELLGPVTKPASLARQVWRFVPVCLALLLIGLALRYGYSELQGSRDLRSALPKLALIQPNIDQFDKMNSHLVVQVYNFHEELTRQAAAAKPAVIIWPETSLFTYLLYDPVLLPRVQKLARETKAWLLIGTPNYDGHGKIFNTLVSFSPSGEVVSLYSKEQLVPFGEYLPFRALLYPFLKSTGYFDSGFNSDPQPGPIYAGRSRIAAAICFESTFPTLIKNRVDQDTQFILTVTNDGWFDDSAAPDQHFESGVFRAIENRRYFVQVGNTGISGVIDPYGRIMAKSELNRRQIVQF